MLDGLWYLSLCRTDAFTCDNASPREHFQVLGTSSWWAKVVRSPCVKCYLPRPTATAKAANCCTSVCGVTVSYGMAHRFGVWQVIASVHCKMCNALVHHKCIMFRTYGTVMVRHHK
jgi:hypothetical protein